MAFECRLSSFAIDPERPYLGASADGIATCKCCPSRVVEIKCPYKHRDVRQMEAARSDPGFCLDKEGILKATHSYYTPVQLQMHVNRMNMGESHWIAISLNQDWMDDSFKTILLPEILSRKLEIQDGDQLEEEEDGQNPDEQLYCI